MTTFTEGMIASSLHSLALPLGQFTQQPIPMGGGGGLPAGALYLHAPKLVLCSTVCNYPMFRKQIASACADLRRDVLLQRNGLHPETLNAVTVDLALHSMGGPFCLDNLSYLRAVTGELWLVPQAGAAFIGLLDQGLILTTEPPYLDDDERSDGLCRAAAEIVRASQRKSR